MKPSPPILFVDDNVSLVAAVEPLLEGYGFRVLKACSGDEAMMVCDRATDRVAVAIVDLKMPGMDGPATINALKKQFPLLKVISISGNVLSPYFSRLVDLGVRHFLPKPFSIDDLVATIQDVRVAA